MANIKRYDNAPGMMEDATGLWVLWSDVEPLLRPRAELTDEQVLRVVTKCCKLRPAWARTPGVSLEQYTAACRKALEEVIRG